MWRIPPGGFLGFSELELADSQGCFTCVRPQFWWIWNLMRIQAKQLILRALPPVTVFRSHIKSWSDFPCYFAFITRFTCSQYVHNLWLQRGNKTSIGLIWSEIYRPLRVWNTQKTQTLKCWPPNKAKPSLKSRENLFKTQISKLVNGFPLSAEETTPPKEASQWSTVNSPEKKKKNIKIMRAQIAQTKMHKSCTFDGSQKSVHSLSTEISA